MDPNRLEGYENVEQTQINDPGAQKWRGDSHERDKIGDELTHAATLDEAAHSKFSLNESISRISRKFSVSNDSMASLFSRKASEGGSASTSSLSYIGANLDSQVPEDGNPHQVKQAFNNTLGRLWSKKGPSSLQQGPPTTRNRSNSTPTSLHSNTLPLPRKLSLSGPFKRIMSNPAAHPQHIPNSSRSSSASISTNPDYANDIFSTPLGTPAGTPVAMTHLTVNTTTGTLIAERNSPIDVVDIADEYFFRNPSMTINESEDIDHYAMFSPNTLHSSQLNLHEHSGWALQDGVLVSQGDVIMNSEHCSDSVTGLPIHSKFS